MRAVLSGCLENVHRHVRAPYKLSFYYYDYY